MSRRAKHVSMVLSMIVASSACSKDTCEDNPNLFMCGVASADDGGTDGTGDTGDTGGPIERECVPLDDDEQEIPYTYPCEGEGNGWMSLNIYGMGVLPPVCANWGEQGQPDNPTTDDCVPLDMSMLPNDVPSPAACCLDDAELDSVHTQCVKDCAYAACKLAIAKLREAADALPQPGVGKAMKKGQLVAKKDLLGFAAMLSAPRGLKHCADLVIEAEGKVALVNLGSGSSKSATLGHIKNATMALQCSLDQAKPYVPLDQTCDAPANIPTMDQQAHMDGEAARGTITILARDKQTKTSLSDIAFGFTETLNRDGQVEFLLTDFSARSETIARDAFVLMDASLELSAPASGNMVGEIVSFPPGALRMIVTARVIANDEALLGGGPMSGVYLNSDIATAVRSGEGEFSLTAVPFELGDYSIVLTTEPGAIRPRL